MFFAGSNVSVQPPTEGAARSGSAERRVSPLKTRTTGFVDARRVELGRTRDDEPGKTHLPAEDSFQSGLRGER